MTVQQAIRVKPVESEKEFAREFERQADLWGWALSHTYDSRRSRPGFPDYVLWRGERTLFVELKTDVGHSTPAQKACQRGLAGNPHVEVFEWRPRDWPQILQKLRWA